MEAAQSTAKRFKRMQTMEARPDTPQWMKDLIEECDTLTESPETPQQIEMAPWLAEMLRESTDEDEKLERDPLGESPETTQLTGIALWLEETLGESTDEDEEPEPRYHRCDLCDRILAVFGEPHAQCMCSV